MCITVSLKSREESVPHGLSLLIAKQIKPQNRRFHSTPLLMPLVLPSSISFISLMNHQWHTALSVTGHCPSKLDVKLLFHCVLSKTVFSKLVSKDVHSETWNSSVFLLNWGQVHGERTQSVINQWVCIFHSLCTSLSLYIFNKYINNWGPDYMLSISCPGAGPLPLPL